MSKLIDSTPRADGFRMPGEFEPQAQIWMLWPQRPDNWRLGAKPAQRSWVDVATAISRFEPVTVGVNNDQYENAVNVLPASVRVIEISSNDAWMRDCGPTFVVNDKGDVRLVDWDFNAWGGLYDGLYFPWEKDQLVPQKVAQLERVDRYKAPLVMEGGSFHVDGEGTVITTEECLLSPGRNPDLTREQIEQHLRDYLGVEKVDLAGQGHRPRGDQRARRRRRLLRAARRGAGRRHRGRGRLALRAPAGQPARAARDHGREGPAARGHHRADAGHHGDHRGRGLGRRQRRGLDPAAARRQDRRVVPQLPHRQRRHRPADVRRPQRRRGARDHRRRRSPTARSSPCRAARSCSAAATCTASRSSSRAAEHASAADGRPTALASRTGRPALITCRAARRPPPAPCPTARRRSRAGSRGGRRTPWTSRSRRGSAAWP